MWPVLLLGLVLALVPSSHQRGLSMLDIQDIVDQLGDEIITHQGLSQDKGNVPIAAQQDLTQQYGSSDQNEVSDVPHPVKVHNWGEKLDIGQLVSVDVDSQDQPIILHRGNVVWDETSFDKSFELKKRSLIPNDTVLTLDPDTGVVLNSWGANLFAMPHGVTTDDDGNTYITDAGLHQVLRFTAGASKPDLVLGKAFIPGNDNSHFCQPTSVAASSKAGIFFVADGYCNSRVLKYNQDGTLLKIINGNWNVVHSLALFEDDDVLCLSDREGQQIDCFKAGLDRPKHTNTDDNTGKKIVSYTGVGRIYGIASKGTALLAVSGKPSVRGITIDTASEDQSILDQWGLNEGLTFPHDLAISLTGDTVYVADSGLQRGVLHKFEVVRSIEDF
ncbi:hypothetical protein TCAL_09696 [Tigriopus californicus]|uniref:peptidylamidoglycolate lyase n=1 Tax=Tigriopus californicus TaxID=6832 RepID=A0A553NNK0_TIGCA|nr:peptidyl-alpha-hydroxyglycine alpha-amidating lyase 2-like [Tigriopus californicus]XP_059081215.1 peptidyl-alpha-hydroxyglycine alpha-amidating lyase 2-like [Tigriopus californicus]XP_059081216.1 peptidyl-alpha-hydroxyglycine alpha-amidating lyase 2-like [Tigriopus californicus]TRY66996.1 hypothetical protein TCAL_09696 [Tigriopus californicus]|eukprot:TCALIF_09696-PA protein Name:"Similar to Pal2 Peptidyl-alpha-hydroxyglycine alpha-amidating lyase 2 (Drosophila melanogaster)" AED:0.05 eAED:0.05 QI:128/1/1/1/0.85/0.87/8/334/387